MQKWEYKIVILKGGSYEAREKTLNQLGVEGWELVTIYDASIAYLKRPLG